MSDTTSTTRTSAGRGRPPFKVVAVASLAVFAAIFGAEELRLHNGHDPGLQASSSSSASSSSQSQSSGATFDDGFDDGGGSYGSSGYDLPTTRSS